MRGQKCGKNICVFSILPLSYRTERKVHVEVQRQNNDPTEVHEEAVDVEGLEDLFQWASETVADGLDARARRARDQKLKRQVLNIIHRSADWQAKNKYTDEITYLHRRVIALQGLLTTRSEELGDLKQIVLAQYYCLQRIPELEEKVVQLQAQNFQKEEAEEERKHLMTALARLKKERDYLEELVSVCETENSRLLRMFNDTKQELAVLKNRRWWHFLFPAKNK